MNECFYYHVIKKWLKASLVLHTHQLKEDNGKKTKTKRWAVYGVREGSSVEVHADRTNPTVVHNYYVYAQRCAFALIERLVALFESVSRVSNVPSSLKQRLRPRVYLAISWSVSFRSRIFSFHPCALVLVFIIFQSWISRSVDVNAPYNPRYLLW